MEKSKPWEFRYQELESPEMESWRLQVVRLLKGINQEQAEFVDWMLNETFDSMLRRIGEFEDKLDYC